MEKWREKISRWKFDRKMQALITIALNDYNLDFFRHVNGIFGYVFKE